MERRSSDPSTPRSKHSATEQRRRSKINDRQVRLFCVSLFLFVCLYVCLFVCFIVKMAVFVVYFSCLNCCVGDFLLTRKPCVIMWVAWNRHVCFKVFCHYAACECAPGILFDDLFLLFSLFIVLFVGAYLLNKCWMFLTVHLGRILADNFKKMRLSKLKLIELEFP